MSPHNFVASKQGVAELSLEVQDLLKDKEANKEEPPKKKPEIHAIEDKYDWDEWDDPDQQDEEERKKQAEEMNTKEAQQKAIEDEAQADRDKKRQEFIQNEKDRQKEKEELESSSSDDTDFQNPVLLRTTR